MTIATFAQHITATPLGQLTSTELDDFRTILTMPFGVNNEYNRHDSISSPEGFSRWLRADAGHWEYPGAANRNMPGLARLTWDQAHAMNRVIDDHTAALAEAAARAVPTPAQVDNEAALRQAEILGATADQRRKLRTIVEERQAAQALAESRATELELIRQELRNVRNQLVIANSVEIDPTDERVQALFGRAAAEADKQGYCSVYDQISSAVGIPDRETLRDGGWLPKKHFYVDVLVSYEATVRVQVEADSESDAIRSVDNWDSEELSNWLDDADPEYDSHDARNARQNTDDY